MNRGQILAKLEYDLTRGNNSALGQYLVHGDGAAENAVKSLLFDNFFRGTLSWNQFEKGYITAADMARENPTIPELYIAPGEAKITTFFLRVVVLLKEERQV